MIKWWQRRQARREDSRVQELMDRSIAPENNGWIFDAKEPYMLYVLGVRLNMADDDQGYSLGFFERQYTALKREIATSYPSFQLGRVLLQIEACSAGALMANEALRRRLEPRMKLRAYADTDERLPLVAKLRCLVTLDGDAIEFNIVKDGHCKEYGFFIHNHPGHKDGVWWCRSQLLRLAA